MKKIFLLPIFALLVTVQINAQGVRFIEEDKTWHMEGITYTSFEFDLSFTTESDTLINGVHYMQLFEMSDGRKWVVGIFREEEGIVYRYYPKDEQEDVFYDFTLNPGESTDIPISPYIYQCKAMAVDYVTLMDGTSARRLQIASTAYAGIEPGEEPDKGINVWIEGIGSVVHPLLHIITDGMDSGIWFKIMYVKRGNEIIYSHTINGIDRVNASEKDNRAYDLQGRPVSGDAGHGILIKDGRKVWQK